LTKAPSVRRRKLVIPACWTPRPYQMPLWRYLERGGLRADVAAHRRWGKDEVALNWAAVAAQSKPGAYWHLLPEASQGRKAIWDAVNPHTGRRRIDEAFPKALRAATRDGDMMIRFNNGSTWQVCGSDNYNSLVGAPPVGVVFSEWALANARGRKLQGLVNRRVAEVALWSASEPGSAPDEPPSSVTRLVATPPTPAEPALARKSPTIWAAIASAAAAAAASVRDWMAQAIDFVTPDNVNQISGAITPYAAKSQLVAGAVSSLAVVAAMLAAVLVVRKHNEARR
jgi:hypothetical protein